MLGPRVPCDLALTQVEELRAQGVTAPAESSYRSSRQAYADEQDASLAIISVPGAYAAEEARLAIAAGRNVLIFSDNVSVEDEVDIKTRAHEAGLLVMGPDCGTAIINGTALCFANAVNRGPVGVVAASGTGSQEVSVRVDALGSGISQLVGVGGRDLSEAVGGIMMLDALAMLDSDPDTSVILLLSKPPADTVAAKVLAAAGRASKPVVVCFIGAPAPAEVGSNITFAANTRDAALAAVRLASGDQVAQQPSTHRHELDAVRTGWLPGQSDIRGLFCGGTVCDEVYQAIAAVEPETTWSNVAKDPARRPSSDGRQGGNVLLDLGDDDYTQGRPHPMIDPTLRNSEIVKHASDPATAVIVIDVELGYGSHPDPAGAVLPAVTEARKIAADAGRPLEIVGYVLGTDRDPQGKDGQEALLTSAGVRLVDNVVELADVSLQMLR